MPSFVYCIECFITLSNSREMCIVCVCVCVCVCACVRACVCVCVCARACVRERGVGECTRARACMPAYVRPLVRACAWTIYQYNISVVASVMMICGRFMMGIFLANISGTMANMNLARSTYEKKLSIIKVCHYEHARSWVLLNVCFSLVQLD